MAAFTLLGSASPGSATPHFVSLTGFDVPGGGAIEAPWRTLSYAFGQLLPGDTLYVRGGRYYETNVAMFGSGTALAPIVIRGYPGETAIIDPTRSDYRTPGNGAWALVDSTLGEYYSIPSSGFAGPLRAYVDGIPGYENGRLALIPYDALPNLESTLEYSDSSFYVGPGTFESNNHPYIRLSKTTDMHAAEARYGTVFFEEDANPADYSIVVTSEDLALSVQGSYLVFKDLVLEPAFDTILLGNDVHDVRFEGLTVWVGHNGLKTLRRTHHITITQCRFYGDSAPWVFYSDQDSDRPPAPAEELRQSAINITGGAHDWEISYNHLRGSSQYLIEISQDGLTTEAETDISIHHNRMENSADDAMNFEGTVGLGRIEVFENFISNCFHAIGAGKFTPDFQGPLLVYRNVISLLRDPPVNRVEGIYGWNGGGRHGYEHVFKLSGPGFTTQNTHLYHNTIVLLNSGGKGVNLMPENATDGRYANNLMVTVNGRVNGPYRDGTGRFVDGNLYWKMNSVDTERLTDSYDTVPELFSAVGLEGAGLGAMPKRGTDPELTSLGLEVVDQAAARWSLTAASERRRPWDFTLSATSPARGAAVAMPVHPVLGVLPDSRVSQDIGALPYGTTAADFDFFPFDPVANQAPLVDVGPDRNIAFGGLLVLDASVNDDGHPITGALVSRWVATSGPGHVTFADPGAAATTASFTEPGVYTLELVVSDGEQTVSDVMTVNVVTTYAATQSIESASSDDAEESAGVVALANPDLGLATMPMVGLRFAAVAVPAHAEILNAYVDFVASERQVDPAAVELRAQATGDAAAFSAAAGDLSSRPLGSAAVPWAPSEWWAAGLHFWTPNLASLIQEIVDRPDWIEGNALAVLISGESGVRRAVSYDGDPAAAPKLHVQFRTPGTQVGVPSPRPGSLSAAVAPNPIVGSGVLALTLPRAGAARIDVFDLRGRRVAVPLESDALAAGRHEVRIGGKLSPGVYFYRARAAGQTVSGRFLVLE